MMRRPGAAFFHELIPPFQIGTPMPETTEIKNPAGSSPVARITRAMAILGAITALTGVVLTIYLQAQPAMDLSSRIAFEDILLWVWPASIMMMPAATASAAVEIVVVLMAVAANIVLYALAGFAIGSIREKYLNAKGRLPAPTAPRGSLRDARRAILVGAVVSLAFNTVNLGGSFLQALASGHVVWCFILLVPFTLDTVLFAAPAFLILRRWSAFQKWRGKKKGFSTEGGT
jgi:hypothetical protein